MTFTIHKGASEIGGSCVEVCTAKTRIILDIGMPLMNPDGSSFNSSKTDEMSVNELRAINVLPDIRALYDNSDDKETAILISHAHQDHYGLISFVNKKVPVYLGNSTHKLIELTAQFAGKETAIENPRYFENLTPFTFGDIEITPYLMDHTAFDAYAFHLRGEGKSLLYTGDFRAHGRKWKHFYKFLHIAPKNPDWLLMEGTSLSRPKHKFKTEDELENQFVKTLNETRGIKLVYLSGQNIDRLVTIFRACRRSGKIFVIDFYIATVLSELAALGAGLPYPSKGFPEIQVFFPYFLRKKMEKLNKKDLIDRFKEYEITFDEINEKANAVVMTVRTSMAYEIKKIENLAGGTLIYSMWEGYKESPTTERFLTNIVKRGAAITTIHTSGHADCYTLQKLLSSVQPKQLVPIHTLASDNYKDIFKEVTVNQGGNGVTIGNEHEATADDVREKTLFNHIEELGRAHEKTGILPENGFEDFIANNKQNLNYVCEILGINEIQAVLFADMINSFDGYLIPIKRIAEFIGCKPIKLIKHIDDLKVLEEKGIVQINEGSDIEEHWESSLSFFISTETLSILHNGKAPDTAKNLSIDDFFIEIAKLCEDCVQKKSSYQRTIKRLNTLLQNNHHLQIVKQIKFYSLSLDDELILLRFCHYLINLEEESMSMHHLSVLYKNASDFQIVKRKLKSDNHILQEKGLIQNVNEDGFGDVENFCLTEKAKDELFIEIEDQLPKKVMKGIKPASEIPVKQLYYPEKTFRQITELTNLLRNDNFSTVQKRLSEEKMRTGFACLFSGGPGTGKTETVYQIARETGRNIMQVDISDTKSMWFGESEKKIKKLFANYRSAVKHSAVVPILLFNEADAVIGKRQNLGEERNGPGQTENTIQNIILQEIENLNGILIATTNLVQNMDKAFERRFIYKIEFEKPSIDERKLILQTHISDLPPDEVNAVAEKFNLSGGQIENIARRRTVASVLYGSTPSLKTILEYCKDEMAGDNETRRIGFL